MEKVVQSLDELETEALRFLASIKPISNMATLVTLSGELGAGKTAFTKQIAKALGVSGVVNSPTFVLEKIYDLPDKALFDRLIHIDAYRLESGAELASLGFDEIMRDEKNLVILEWPEKVADSLPEPTINLVIETLSETGRKLTYG